MGSCLSCPEKKSIPDNHQSKFKVINVDDDGNELGSGVMELTDTELVLHTHRRDDVRWPYLCLQCYGYNSNLFSFESGRCCQTGQGIFAFKCSRAEEIFNMLQEVMHSHSISVVEEAVLEPSHSAAHTPAGIYMHLYTPAVPNGVTRTPSVAEAPSHPSTRHPSVASTRLPSLGEESTHPLLVGDEVHTYTSSLNGYNHHPQHGLLHHSYSHPLSAALEPSHNYVNTENVTAPLSAHRPDTARRRTDGPTIFNFDFRRPPLPGHPEPPKTLNYIEVEMDNSAGNKGASDGSNPHTPRTPTSPLPPTTPTRRTELYALIDIERTAAMSNLQKARPRDDGTSRKTRHNSTELPTKSTV
uniref:IRS-type PTB domain-containing protein n=1 Tax=Monopterus albus TaxID=43700 RepID=A0A3Q3QW07_MONAL